MQYVKVSRCVNFKNYTRIVLTTAVSCAIETAVRSKRYTNRLYTTLRIIEAVQHLEVPGGIKLINSPVAAQHTATYSRPAIKATVGTKRHTRARGVTL
jgi:hypothetical protein